MSTEFPETRTDGGKAAGSMVDWILVFCQLTSKPRGRFSSLSNNLLPDACSGPEFAVIPVTALWGRGHNYASYCKQFVAIIMCSFKLKMYRNRFRPRLRPKGIYDVLTLPDPLIGLGEIPSPHSLPRLWHSRG